jgi:dienelactone hydrolase
MDIFLKGNHKSFVKLGVIKAKRKSNNVLIIVHGLYGQAGDPNSKSRFLGNTVLKANVAHVVYFSSSRDWGVFKDNNWEKQVEAFKGKTFKQEADDLRDTIDLLLDQSEFLFKVKKDELKFSIIANSIGGSVISTLKDKFGFIDKIVLAGSGTGSVSSDKPILSTEPPESEILKSTSNFTGDVLSIQGGEDSTVPLESQDKLLSGYKEAKSSKIIIEGANHNFSNIFGKDKRLARKLYTNFIIKFLKS